MEYPFIICVWLLGVSYAKILFNSFPRLSRYFPDSSLLIVTGLIFGGLFRLIDTPIIDKTAYQLSADLFFLFLLPPIVFEAGYFMPKRVFFDNAGIILVFAVIGTLWNTFAIGQCLCITV